MADVLECYRNKIRREFGICAVRIAKNSEKIKKYIDLKYEGFHSFIMTSVLPETNESANQKETFEMLFSQKPNIPENEVDLFFNEGYLTILSRTHRKVYKIIKTIDMNERKKISDTFRSEASETTTKLKVQVKRVGEIFTRINASINARVLQTVRNNFFENNIIQQIVRLNNVFMELLQETKQNFDDLHKYLQELLLLSVNKILSENEHRIDQDNILLNVFEIQKEKCNKEFILAFGIIKDIFSTDVESLLGDIVQCVNKHIHEGRELRTSYYLELLTSLESTLSGVLDKIQQLCQSLLTTMSRNILDNMTYTRIDCDHQSDWLKKHVSNATQALDTLIKKEISEVNSKVSYGISLVKGEMMASTLIGPKSSDSLAYFMHSKISMLCFQNERYLYGVQRVFRYEIQCFHRFLLDKIYTGPNTQFRMSSQSPGYSSHKPATESNFTSMYRSEYIEEIIEEPTYSPWKTFVAIKKSEHGSTSGIQPQTEDIGCTRMKTFTNTVTSVDTSMFQVQCETVDPCGSKHKDWARECYGYLRKSSTVVDFSSISSTSGFQQLTRSTANMNSNEIQSGITCFATTNGHQYDFQLSAESRQNHSLLLRNETRALNSSDKEIGARLIEKDQSNFLEHSNSTFCENYRVNLNSDNILDNINELSDHVENTFQLDELGWEHLSKNIDSAVNALFQTNSEFNFPPATTENTYTSIANQLSPGQAPLVESDIVTSELASTSSSTERTIGTGSSALSDQDNELISTLVTILQNDNIK